MISNQYMKIQLLNSILATIFCFQALGQTDTALASRLKILVAEDQRARHLLDNLNDKPFSGEWKQKRDSIWAIINGIDKKNNTELKQIIKKLDRFPGYDIVGEQGAKDYWLLVQHQDHDTAFQKQVLSLMNAAVDNKNAPAEYYAYLVDRVRLNCGQKQLYGTQCWDNADKTHIIPRPLEDSLNVNIRRAQMGMETIELYLQMVNRQYGKD